jgi:hypothetical protein
MKAQRISKWAEQLDTTTKAIRRAIHFGHLHAVQLGRGPNSPYYATEDQIRAWLDKREVVGRRAW